jgi:8-oxo-dGTP diphosphatase
MEDFIPLRPEIKRGRDFIGVGVGAVIVDEHRQILLLLRRKAPEIDHWTIPGGTVEFGETLEDAILRELREEIGVACIIDRLLGVTNHILSAEQKHWVSPAFLVHITSGVPENKEPAAHAEMQWYPIEGLPTKITLTTAKALDYYRQYLGECKQ